MRKVSSRSSRYDLGNLKGLLLLTRRYEVEIDTILSSANIFIYQRRTFQVLRYGMLGEQGIGFLKKLVNGF